MLRFVLFPFAIAYDLATNIRNVLYDRGYKPSAAFEIPLISVGNVTIGGTGKTPMIEYLIRLLGSYRVSTLSRGYGRKTRGLRIATETDNAATIGDEPSQLFRKFGSKVTVAVAEERVLGISSLLHDRPDTDVILLDDAFQHRKVRPSLQIVLTDFNRPFYTDFVLPMGRLRESRKGVSRADLIVVTKCPQDLQEEQMMRIEEEIRTYSDKPVFFATVRYGTPLGFEWNNVPATAKIVLVTGIAAPGNLVSYLKQHYSVIRHFDFPDHHSYNTAEIRKICEVAGREGASVITTEKDAVKLDSSGFREICTGIPFFYLPIQTEFLKNGKEFDEMVLNVLRARDAL
jgi:tetraacyldisaccharide 4'-kinase